MGQFRDQLIVNLRSDWEVKPGLLYGKGSLLVVSIKEFVALGPQGTVCMLLYLYIYRDIQHVCVMSVSCIRPAVRPDGNTQYGDLYSHERLHSSAASRLR